MHVALNDVERSDDRRIFCTSAPSLTIFKMKTLDGSNVVILDGGLVCNNLGSGCDIWSHLRPRDLS